MAYVVIDISQYEHYLARGYVKSKSTVDELTESSIKLPFEVQKDLIVMELDDSKHEALNRAPVKYVVRSYCDTFVTESRVRPVNVKFRDVDDEDRAIVAFADVDYVPIEVDSAVIFETEFGAAADSASYLRSQIDLHRAAIANIERFLKKYELG